MIFSDCKFKDSSLVLASLMWRNVLIMCHMSLSIKLRNALPQYQWLYTSNWYKNLNCTCCSDMEELYG